MESRERTSRIELQRYWPVIRRSAWVVALPVVLAVVAALVYSKSQTPLYESSALVRPFDPVATTPFGAGRADPLREVSIQALYAQSPKIKNEVNDRLGPDAKRLATVSVAGVLDADAIQITVQAPKKDLAQRAAQTYADVFVARRRDAEGTPLLAQAKQLRDSAAADNAAIANLDRSIAAAQPPPKLDPSGHFFLPPETEQLKAFIAQRNAAVVRQDGSIKQADQLDIQAIVVQNAVNLVSPASRPDAPVVPATSRNLVIGLGVGFLVGLGIAFVRARLDNRVRTVPDLERIATAGFVVPVPKSKPRRGAVRGAAALIAGQGPAEEAYRSLRAYLVLSKGERAARSLLFTSPEAADDLSAAKLAVNLAKSGANVALVDADLRSSRLRDAFEVKSKGDGLAGVIRSKGLVQAVIQTIKIPGSGNLDFVDSGGPVDDPADLLISQAASRVLEQLKASHDYLVINGPPVLASADGLPLAQWVDGVVLIAGAGRVGAGAVEESLEELRSVSAPMVGMVLTGAPAGRRRKAVTKKAGRVPSRRTDSETSSGVKAVPKADAKRPEARTPEAKRPDARTPEARTPEAKRPDARTPDARTPDARTPEAAKTAERRPAVSS